MDNKKHPKRKKDRYNPYTLRIIDGKYILSFVDTYGNNQSLSIDEQLYCLFDRFELQDVSYMNEVSRHIEYSELTEQSLNKRVTSPDMPIEDKAIQNNLYSKLYISIESLPSVQRRRIILKYFYNMTIEEIAQIEQCSTRAVDYSLYKALRALREKMECDY